MQKNSIIRVAATTLGCKVNFYDTEAMLSVFSDKGCKIVNFNEIADVYIINTCTVTSLADKKSRQMIRRAKTLNPTAVIVACGCYAQVAPEETAKIDGVNIVLGTKDRLKVFEAVENYMNGVQAEAHVTNIMNEREFEPLKLGLIRDRHRVYVKIQDGCDMYCTYCIIPYARGHIRSRDFCDIVNEVIKIAESGIKEIILTGIHIASYGKDLDNTDLYDVLSAVHKIKGIERIRLGSLEPSAITEKFIEEIIKMPKFCKHFHLSLQSGCNKTLKNMNRRYTTNEYKSAVQKIRDAFPDASLTTDIIVGFPDETEEDFLESINFVSEIQFMKVHVFPFSAKKGTPAANMPNQISKTIKNSRAKNMSLLNIEQAKSFYSGFVGREVEILVEEETESGVFFGHTDNYIPVYANSKSCVRINTIQKVQLNRFDDVSMFGEVLSD